MIQRTLVLIKPDGVQRGLTGKIIERFENAGLKIIGMKMQWVNKEFALKHYTEDVERRRGKHVRTWLVDFLVEGPTVALAIEGVHAINNVRKIVGETEPMKAVPGTIRGDFAHVSLEYCNTKKVVVRNLVHASGNEEEAKYELKLWFSPKELHSYKTVHEQHIY